MGFVGFGEVVVSPGICHVPSIQCQRHVLGIHNPRRTLASPLYNNTFKFSRRSSKLHVRFDHLHTRTTGTEMHLSHPRLFEHSVGASSTPETRCATLSTKYEFLAPLFIFLSLDSTSTLHLLVATCKGASCPVPKSPIEADQTSSQPLYSKADRVVRRTRMTLSFRGGMLPSPALLSLPISTSLPFFSIEITQHLRS